jgi:hypothetical protein
VRYTKNAPRNARRRQYDLAERLIPPTVAHSRYKPHELVEYLSEERGVPPDIASTMMWTLIGDGTLHLSGDWHLSLPRK